MLLFSHYTLNQDHFSFNPPCKHCLHPISWIWALYFSYGNAEAARRLAVLWWELKEGQGVREGEGSLDGGLNEETSPPPRPPSPIFSTQHWLLPWGYIRGILNPTVKVLSPLSAQDSPAHSTFWICSFMLSSNWENCGHYVFNCCLLW